MPAGRGIDPDIRLYALHLISLGVPKTRVAKWCGISPSGIESWLQSAAKPRYTQCELCGEWICHPAFGSGMRRKYCEGECQRVMRLATTQRHRDGKIDPLCRWCLVALKASRSQVCSDECSRQWTNHRLAHGADLWCVLPLCCECGLVKGINHAAGLCRGCLATASKRREALRPSRSNASCESCGVDFGTRVSGDGRYRFCEECLCAKRAKRERLHGEALAQERLRREAIPRPLCEACLSIVPVSRRRYCSGKCQRIMANHYRYHGTDLWRILPLCLRCKLVKGINQNTGYCRACSVVVKKEAKKRTRMQQTMTNKDRRYKEFYLSGDKISRQGVLDRTGYRCHLCKKRVRLDGDPNHPLYFQVDHIIPRSKGGTNTWDNVATCCRSCNGKKGNRAANDQLRLLTLGAS